MTTTASPAIEYFAHCLNITLGYAERVLDGIPADTFAHMPHPGMNHPAFCIGHLSLYPARILTMLGRPELAVEKPGWAELFQAGVACVEQDGRYPGKDELIAHYFEGYRTVGAILPEVTEQTLQQPNPIEGRMKELLPTAGAMVNFMLNNHQMVHLGQISAWRRAMGMGSAM